MAAKPSTLRNLAILAALALLASLAWAANNANNAVDFEPMTIQGSVVDESGKAVRGATVTLFDRKNERSVSVYSDENGKYSVDGMPSGSYEIRARLLGLEDTWGEIDSENATAELKMAPAADLNAQRPAVDLISMLKWEDEKDSLNFKMMCAYCHQVGTVGFRSPEEPVDWEVMLTRMDGFQGLYDHTQEVLVDKIYNTFGREAEEKWEEWKPWDRPEGEALDGMVAEWEMGTELNTMIHDLSVSRTGLIYTVDMTNDAVVVLNPDTHEREVLSIPGGKEFGSDDPPIKGPHSIEETRNGDLWITLALSGQMAKLDPKTKEYTVVSGHEAPRPRGGYPHTLREGKEGKVWWTDAGLGVFNIDPETMKVKFFDLPDANQVRGGGARGESRGVTPYGIDVAPDGDIWYTKLNGQRVGRIQPQLADDDPNKIVEWKPPVHGPRRLHVDADGMVWVPGWASGDIAKFDEYLEEWTVYDLPHGPDSLPYALNINPVTGDIWICGTGTDSMLRFDPKTEKFVEYRMPTRVTYTREIEFDAEGNVWTVNSNYPVRHVENLRGSVIKVAVR